MSEIRKAFVTGGAGFIGSHVVDRLCAIDAEVVVYDNLSTGSVENLRESRNSGLARLVTGDVLDCESLTTAMEGADTVFHFQANADVRGGMDKRRIDLEQNTTTTLNVLEAMVRTGAKTIVFASSATVYGEPAVFPTPEDLPLVQTSLYGASKLAGEALLQAYAEYFGIRTITFRFVSWIGPRYSHGVIFDFLKKLRADPSRLEVLGDGRQRKSYLDVRDGISGIFTAIEKGASLKSIYNLGHDDFLNVLDLATIVIDEAGLDGVRVECTGGERGWIGDAPFVHLDTTRMKDLGWRPAIPIEQGIRDTVRHLLDNPSILDRRN